jgi:hypothetical protein
MEIFLVGVTRGNLQLEVDGSIGRHVIAKTVYYLYPLNLSTYPPINFLTFQPVNLLTYQLYLEKIHQPPDRLCKQHAAMGLLAGIATYLSRICCMDPAVMAGINS